MRLDKQGMVGAAVSALLLFGPVQAALAAVEGSAQAAPGYAAVQRAAQRKPARVEDVKALESILGPSVRISPTRFERYISCPFAYFMQYVLGARPRQKAELAPNISGTLTHWVLEQALRREGSAFAKLTQPQLEQLVESLVQEYTAANLPGAGVRMNYLLGRIQRNLVGLALAIQWRDRAGFSPASLQRQKSILQPLPARPGALRHPWAGEPQWPGASYSPYVSTARIHARCQAWAGERPPLQHLPAKQGQICNKLPSPA